MTIDHKNPGDVESDLTEPVQSNDAAPQTAQNPSDAPRNRKRKVDKREALDASDEAIAQYMSTPRSVREFKSFAELGEHFDMSRMTVYRRTKDPLVLQRVESLVRHYRLAGDLVAKVHWPRIMRGLVRAAAAGDTKAAEFCLERAWPETNPLDDILKQITNSREE